MHGLINKKILNDHYAMARFWSKVSVGSPSACWAWSGNTTGRGYGVFNYGFDKILAHRLAYSFLVGKIPNGLTIDHLCKNKLCENPGHMEPVTNRENILRSDSPSAVNARKTKCGCGNPFDKVTSQGARICIACTIKKAEACRLKNNKARRDKRREASRKLKIAGEEWS